MFAFMVRYLDSQMVSEAGLSLEAAARAFAAVLVAVFRRTATRTAANARAAASRLSSASLTIWLSRYRTIKANMAFNYD
ncbi:hypothetical protein ACFX2I_002033 [Malus domestica]